jgi:hypothetical protein
MPIRRFVPLALAAVLSASLARSASAQTPVPSQSAESAKAQPQTVSDMRNVGTALFSWLVDRVEDADAVADPETDRACVSWLKKEGAEECEVLEIDRLPLISYQELTRLLIPKYIDTIPEKDGWGHPFEFHLDRKHVLNKSVIAIRSAGSDGTFSGNRYKLGAFRPSEAGQDLVWLDGFFIRWPEKGVNPPR